MPTIRTAAARALRHGAAPAALILAAITTPAAAQNAPPARPAEAGVKVFEAASFAQYAPASALDIVRRVPGFVLDQGNVDVRGLADAAGNVVLNGLRPSSKTDTLDTILARIPARRVLRVELAPGTRFGSDYAARDQVLNVVLGGADGVDGHVLAKATRLWDGRVIPNAEAAAFIRHGASRVSLSASANRNDQTEVGFDRITDHASGTLLEYRAKTNYYAQRDPNVSASWALEQAADRSAHVNFKWGPSSFDLLQVNDDRPVGQPVQANNLIQTYRFPSYELGADLTRPLAGGALKLVALANRRERHTYDGSFERVSGQIIGGEEQFVDARYDEAVARAIWSRARLAGMAVELGGELAHNQLDDNTRLFSLDPGGARVPEVLPIARARVAEWRGEGWLQAGRQLSPALRIDTRLAFESSALTVSGDSSAHRALRFFKPSLSLDWKGPQGWHAQASLRRTVAQLNFYDFIANAELASGQVSGGNADLQPQRAWEARLTLEHPLLAKGLARLELGHDEVSALQDRILTPDGFDAPGNLGHATRSFAKLTLDTPLDQLGLHQLRLRTEGRIQTSEVRDPLSGAMRPWSGFWPAWDWKAELRKDFADWSLGATVQDQGRIALYLTTEVDSRANHRPFGTFFAEYRPDKRTSVRLDIDNFLDGSAERFREFYAPDRSAPAPGSDELRIRSTHVAASLTLRRSFSLASANG